MTTIRLVISISLHYGWKIQQLDVKNAFLHGTISENIYMAQPPGFISSIHPTYVCHLRKAIYGQRQAPRAWYARLSQFVVTYGFIMCQSDNSLFVRHDRDSITILLVYVDDILLTGSNSGYITQLLTVLHQHFAMRHLGELNHFLGIEFIPTASSIILSQQRYITQLLKKAGMEDCKSSPTPMEATKVFNSTLDLPYTDSKSYRSLVGALQYLTITRPDITFAVNKACQFMHEPLQSHYQLLKRILRYLKGTLNYGLYYTSGPLLLHAYAVADWAGDQVDRRSVSGYCIYFGNNPIMWTSKKQVIVSRSSTEAEYRSLASTTAEICWITMLLRELKLSICQTPVI